MDFASLTSLRVESARYAAEHDYSDEAIAVHRRVSDLDGSDRAAANRLGIALLKRGRFSEAEAIFATTLEADPRNAIARRRLQEARDRLAAGAQPPAPVGSDREEWPEYVERNPAEIKRCFLSGTDNWKRGLQLLADRAPARMTYPHIDEALGWPRGRWRSVVGGTRSADGEALRPFHICSPALSRSGEWEAWMDREQAAAFRE